MANPGTTVPVIERVMRKIERIPFSGCWIFMGATNESGYGIVGTGKRGEPTDRAHRVTYRHFKGQIPAGLVACHCCDVPQCCNPEHLFLGTHADNHQDALRKGRHSKPPRNIHLRRSAHYAARFTERDIEAIWLALRAEETCTAIAARYGVTRDCIGKIKRGERWK